ncbi:MAG: serine hydrolase domain-containing protein [Myxococcota bacterium]
MLNPNLQIAGTVAPGFESVRDLYAIRMATLAERNTQLCVYHKGEKVVDLWATQIGDRSFTADSLVNIFSSGKSMESIALASLHGRGLLDYDKKIADYWPEFAQNGKQDLAVADLMRHETGLASFDRSLDPEALFPENLKKNAIAPTVEAQRARFPERDDTRREYHALTRGWIANEVFRRVDPAGRTIGEFLREEVSVPLEVEVYTGLRAAEIGRVSPVEVVSFLFVFLQSLLPKALGRRIEKNVFQLGVRIYQILRGARKGSTIRRSVPPLEGKGGFPDFNDRAIRMGETPSANTHSNARSLAKIAAALAAGGTLGEQKLLDPAACEALHAETTEADMIIMPTSFSQGGVNAFRATHVGSPELGRALNEGREGFFGWMGLGGSIFQWHPEHEIGFGYVPTSLHVLDLFNERGKAYQAEVLRCVERLAAA